MSEIFKYMKATGLPNWRSNYDMVKNHAKVYRFTLEQELALRDENFHLLPTCVNWPKELDPTIEFDDYNGGCVIRCLNYAKKGESLYQVHTTKGVFKTFDNKDLLINWIKEHVK